MKNLLALLIVAAAAGAGYEYYLHNQDSDQYVQQRTELTANIDKLKKQNKDLADDESVLKEKLNYLQKQAADLQSQADGTSGKTNAAPVSGQ